jgi:hypothetical protein
MCLCVGGWKSSGGGICLNNVHIKVKSNDRSQSLVKVIAATIGLPFRPCSLVLFSQTWAHSLCDNVMYQYSLLLL